MASIINASSSGSGGIVQTADASGVLQLQSNGTAAVTVTGNNVGVGTASPTPLTGYTVLEVNGDSSGSVLDMAQGDVMKGRFVAVSAGFTIETNTGLGINFAPSGTQRMTLSSAGYLTVSAQPSFYSNGNATASTGSPSSWNTPQNNVGSAFNTTNGRFTAPVAGRYMFLGNLSCNSVTIGNWIGFGFTINGTGTNFGLNYQTASTTNDTGINSCVVLQLSAGDYVQFWLANQGSWTNIYSFSGYLLG